MEEDKEVIDFTDPNKKESHSWFATLNNPEETRDFLEALVTRGKAKYSVGLYEMSPSGTPHLLFTVMMKDKTRLAAMKKING